MRLKHDRLIRPFALIAMAMLAMAAALVWGTGVSLAIDYQDAHNNACEGAAGTGPTGPTGTTGFPGCSTWGSHVTGSENVALGAAMMPALTSGSVNVALGTRALFRVTTGSGNIASGFDALLLNTTGNENVANGYFALTDNTTGSNNIASGSEALHDNEVGNRNVAIGEFALTESLTGNDNVAIGTAAGAFAHGSNNINISNPGGEEEFEANTTRIGTEGTQTKAFIAGIQSTSISGCTVQVSVKGQLGCNPAAGGPTGSTGPTGPAGPSASAAIATFASFGGVGSGKCLNYTELASQGNGNCPAKTTGWSNSNLLAGPTPASGATVTNLYADSNATVKGSDTVLVAVIDNTTGATLLSCEVNSTNKKSCSNISGSGSAAAGDNIEVKLTATGGSGNNKPWRVRFRY